MIFKHGKNQILASFLKNEKTSRNVESNKKECPDFNEH